jgi:hypothetical protein
LKSLLGTELIRTASDTTRRGVGVQFPRPS